MIVLAACDPPGDPDALAARMPIVDGTRELGEPAVVVVQVFGGVGLCTGTLITPSVVLTAKHCVQAPNATAPYPASAFTIGVGNTTRDIAPYRVIHVETTPGPYSSDPSVGLGGALVGVDVGVLVLRTPVPDVTPIPVRRDIPSDMIGQTFTAIGFGQRPDGGSGLKYKTTGTLAGISGTILFTAQVICSGDSGGPMIQETPERRVIGVASFGEAGACPSSQDGYNGLFQQMDLIDRAIVISGGCVDLGEERCDSLDNDCDGEIDEGCAGIGESCTADTDCMFAQLPSYLTPLEHTTICQDLGAGPVCTRTCDPLAPSLGCAEIPHFGHDSSTVLEGYYCGRTSGCEGRCMPGAAGTAPDGTSCASDTECASLSCGDPGDGNRRCLPMCRSGDATCPVGEACAASLGVCGLCVDAELLAASRQIGEPCDSDAHCASGGTCQSDPAGAYCTHACITDAECPSTFRCEASLCMRGARGRTGDPCAENVDCGVGGFCADQGGRRWCSQLCNETMPCPDGLNCVPAGGTQLCAPAGMILGESCGGASECSAGLCESDVCTRACGTESACPGGFSCRRDDDGNARCLRAPSGGCSAAPGPRAPGVLLLMAIAALALGVRQKRARA